VYTSRAGMISISFFSTLMGNIVKLYSSKLPTQHDVHMSYISLFYFFQSVHTKLGICVNNHICNKMTSTNKVNFQKSFW